MTPSSSSKGMMKEIVYNCYHSKDEEDYLHTSHLHIHMDLPQLHSYHLKQYTSLKYLLNKELTVSDSELVI